MPWRFIRGRKQQEGRVALMRGPLVCCIGVAQNAELAKTCKDLRELTIDPASLGKAVPDSSVRPAGLKVKAKAWPPGTPRQGVAPLDVVLTEFVDPSGIATYFHVPTAVPTIHDELLDGK